MHRYNGDILAREQGEWRAGRAVASPQAGRQWAATQATSVLTFGGAPCKTTSDCASAQCTVSAPADSFVEWDPRR